MSAPALVLAVQVLAGAAASILLYDVLPRDFAFACAAAGLIVWLAAAAAHLIGQEIEAALLLVLGATLGGLSLGAADAVRAYQSPLSAWFDAAAPEGPVIVEGVLREDAAPTPPGVSLTLDVHAIAGPGPRLATRGGIRLSVGGALLGSRAREWRAGRTIRAPAVLRRPSVYLNPGTADERRALARRGVVLVGSVKSAALVEVTGRGTRVQEAAAAIRAWTRREIGARVAPFDSKSAGVATAVLIGDRSGLDTEDERRLQAAGTYHVIAISGGNIAMLAVAATLAWRLLLVPLRAAAVLTAAALLFYGAIAGGAASVSRAVTVAVLVLAARALDHRGAPLNALAMAALLAVAASPVVVFDAGFILSFGATLGILLGLSRLGSRHHVRRQEQPFTHRLAAAAGWLFAATICAEIALAPVAATMFARVSFAGLLLNFAAIPLMAVVQLAGLAVAAASPWWDAGATVAAAAVHGGSTALLQSARLVDIAPWLVRDVAPPVWWLTGAYYASVAGLLVPRAARMSRPCWVAAAALLLIGPRAMSRDAVPPAKWPLRVTVLDVGQGDATVISLPGGHQLLVDAGGLAPLGSSPDATDTAPAFDVGDRVVTPALTALGATRLNGLVITHGDPDHLLGAAGVLRRRAAASIWEGVPVPRHAGLRALWDHARKQGATWRTVQAGDRERFGEVELRVLHPPPPDWERQRVRNDDSVVLEVRLGAVSIILPGDIGAEAERAIVPRLEPGRLVVLKAPHHGSATSSTTALLDRLRPAAVIFSCGRANRFGHPHPAVVARYAAVGASMFSTADDGAVFIETDGSKVEARGWTGKRMVFEAQGPAGGSAAAGRQ